MSKVNQKTGHGRRLGLLAKLLLLVPICFVLGTGVVLWTQHASGSSWLAGSSRSYPATLGFVVAHIEGPVSGWDIRRYHFGDLTAQEVFVHFDLESRYVWRKPFSDQSAVERTVEMQITGVSGNGSTGTRIVQSAFEREFGSDWTRLKHPALISSVVPAVESEAVRAFSRWAGLSPVRVTSTLSATSPLIAEWSEFGPRISWIIPALRWSVLIWLVLAVAVVVHLVLTKERQARRWITMKCPQCGYERQRDRDECPECGLVYERPSYVMWDPTEEEAASVRDDSPSPRSSPAGGEGG